jgi:hypothetical protein
MPFPTDSDSELAVDLSVRFPNAPIVAPRWNFRHSAFVINGQSGSDSHVFDHVIAELRTFNFRRAFHQTREIIGYALARDRAG